MPGVSKCLTRAGDYNRELCLLDAQKLMRFAIKFWDNLRLSANERVLSNSTKAVIFPHPISQQTSFRISLELRPDARRQSRRAPEDRSMLVYRSGFDEGGGPHEQAQLRNFRLFLDARRSILSASAPPNEDQLPTITSLSVTTLDGPPTHTINPFLGYSQWLELLTSKQKAFVTSPLVNPHRIEGPAGTGKTLCLILKAITGLRAASDASSEHKALFITHSEATRKNVSELIASNDPWRFSEVQPELRLQTLKVSTLQQLCGELLQRDLADAEFLDKDAMESKQLQVLHIEDALSETLSQDYSTYRSFLSPSFDKFLTSTAPGLVAEMIQHEISIVIKGRAEESLENYRKLPILKYGLPAITIDETHLFNVNELSSFHFLSRSVASFPIAYSVDRSQAVGDRGWSDEGFEEVLSPAPGNGVQTELTEVKKIFRCSPEIVDLAFSVTSSGATLFTNFNDPLRLASSMFTAEEERKSSGPVLFTCGNDEEMIAEAFRRAEAMADALESSRCDVAVIVFSEELLTAASSFAKVHNKPVEILKQRGDIEVVRRAQQTKRFIVTSPDYVGGLEFSGVILVGVDDGRVPPSRTTDSAESNNFLSYAAHNRLYVAITRAKYRVDVLVAKERGPSTLLMSAIQAGLLSEG